MPSARRSKHVISNLALPSLFVPNASGIFANYMLRHVARFVVGGPMFQAPFFCRRQNPLFGTASPDNFECGKRGYTLRVLADSRIQHVLASLGTCDV